MNEPYLTVLSSLDDQVRRIRKFDLLNLKGEEGINMDFSYRLILRTPERLKQKEIDLLLGKALVISIAYPKKNLSMEHKYIHGIVYSLKESGVDRQDAPRHVFWEYEIEIGSYLRNLTFFTDCRIFQKSGNTCMKIVNTIMREFDYSDYRNEAGSLFPERDFVVQYNESPYDFIFRILQRDNVHFRWEHSKEAHDLIFFREEVRRLPDVKERPAANSDRMKQFHLERNYMPVEACQTGWFEWENPQRKSARKVVDGKKKGLTHYEYGHFTNGEDAKDQMLQRVNTYAASETLYSGRSTIRNFEAGRKFTLKAPLLEDSNEDSFLIRHLRIEADQETYTNWFSASSGLDNYTPYKGEFEVRTPLIEGYQTATVVGDDSSSKVDTDEYGRVLVNFPWDHRSPEGKSVTSAFIRVSHTAAGQNRGFLFTPKIGENLVVAFDGGNPDYPLAIGSSYTGNNNPAFNPRSRPYDSLIKTHSDGDSNQILFSDQPGSEKLEIRAKKDMKWEVGGDLDINVKGDATIRADSLTIMITKDTKITAGGSIANLALVSVASFAGVGILSAALGGVFNLAGGIVMNMAGGLLANTSIVSVANTSAMGIEQSAGTVIMNSSLSTILNTAPNISSNSSALLSNISMGAIINLAEKEMATETLLLARKINGFSSTEAKKISAMGLTGINS